MKWDAFISYRRDTGFLMAQVLYCRLELEGYHCFLDLEEEKRGEFDKALIEAIQQSPNFILILSRDSMDRCINEDDWVRQEILAARTAGKTIIPVLSEDYDASTVPVNLPEEIHRALRIDGIRIRQEYMSAAVNTIISRMDNTHCSRFPLSTNEFFRYYLEHRNVTGIDMAFHAGGMWYTELVTLLNIMMDKKIPIRILVNSKNAVRNICQYMKQEMKDYTPFPQNIKKWQKRIAMHPDLLEMRVVTDLPMLHRIYLVHTDKGDDAANVKYYTYDNGIIENDYRTVFTADSPEYALYAKEFEFLWKHAEETAKEAAEKAAK